MTQLVCMHPHETCATLRWPKPRKLSFAGCSRSRKSSNLGESSARGYWHMYAEDRGGKLRRSRQGELNKGGNHPNWPKVPRPQVQRWLSSVMAAECHAPEEMLVTRCPPNAWLLITVGEYLS